MRTTMTVMTAVAVLAGCATSGREKGAIEGEEIRYETTPCYGTCPVYVVTVRPDGSGTFEGREHVAVTGTQSLRATPEDYRRFADALKPYRPASGERLIQPGGPECGGPMVSDLPSVDVRWTEASGAGQHLHVYFGCGGTDLQAMREAIRAAPDALPLRALIGRR